MTTKIELVIDGVDLTDLAVLDVLAEHFPHLAWAMSGGVTTAAILSDVLPKDEAARFAERLPRVLPGAQVVRVHDDLVGASEISSRVGVSRQAVHAWASGERGPGDFPTPVATISGGARPTRIWRWRDVNRWLEARALDDGFTYPAEHVVADLNAMLACPRAATSKPNGWAAAVPTIHPVAAVRLAVTAPWPERLPRGSARRSSLRDRVWNAWGDVDAVAVDSTQALTARGSLR